MALDLYVTIRGDVGPDVVRLLVNGVEKPLTGRGYEVEVHVADDLIALTTIDGANRETTRTIRLTTTDIIAG